MTARWKARSWISGPHGLLKTDYEHHGIGKDELNVDDPAYDLAATILDLSLSPAEESSFIRSYIECSGDTSVEQRLFLNKLMAGFWAIHQTEAGLFGGLQPKDQQQKFHDQYIRAWNFLICLHTARFCGRHCGPLHELRWRSPIVMLDVDGVLDRRIFGFPCITAAGMRALSLLRAHGFSFVSLNTARPASEVRDYCQAYGLAGGVAEHGSYMWDAVAQRERVLIPPETMRQLSELRTELRRLPGIFLDERHQYSIRAFTYQPGRRPATPPELYLGCRLPDPNGPSRYPRCSRVT